ncbi:MAG: HD domain-containing protein [Oscillospiraceae bacterium]|nr:HD domain-containing protein [Oscillospiraceae bacterium]
MEENREVIVMVDDDLTNLNVARNNLSGVYSIVTVPSGAKLFNLLDKITPALILLDIEMPEMNGYEVLKKLKENGNTAHIPVIFLTAKIDPASEIEGLNLGAVDYITKPFSRDLLIKRINLHLLIEKQKKELLNYNLSLESEVGKQTQAVLELQNAIIQIIAELVECRDSVTGGHIGRTQHYITLLVDFLIEHDIYADEIAGWDTNLFAMSSQLHDVGKITIRDDILRKPGRLTDEEYEEIKSHTISGLDIIKRIEENTTESEFLVYAAALAGSHHERWDGTGYPNGLKGIQIPLQGRIMALVDVYDALTNDRPYKEALTHEEAVDIIKEGNGTHFDPLIANVFLMHEKEFKDAKVMPKQTLEQNEEVQPTLETISDIICTRTGNQSGSSERVRNYLEVLVDALRENEHFKEEISSWNTELFLMSAQIHDIGKLGVSGRLLNKDAGFTSIEFDSMKNHVDYGVQVIQKLKSQIDHMNVLNHAEALTGSHHERWDGSGYPNGLKGYGIPLQGRIMAVVDVYDALTSDRPHRKKKTHEEAVEIIRSGSGSHFDPGIVNTFLENEELFRKIKSNENIN